MINLKTFELFSINEMYFGIGYENDAKKELAKLLPDYEITSRGNEIDISKRGQVLAGRRMVKIADIEIGPQPGYRYAKLSFYNDNGEWTGSVAVDKVEDIPAHIVSNK